MKARWEIWARILQMVVIDKENENEIYINRSEDMEQL